jgi:hypothetical protein
VCIEQHLVTLTGVSHQPKGTTGAQLQMGYLHLVKHPANQQSLLTPVKLECLAELEAQWYKSLGGVLDTFLAPSTNEGSNCAVATPVSLA